MASGDKQTTVTYEQQALMPVSKLKKEWESCLEYPADHFSLSEVVEDTKAQQPIAEKPLRVVKVTVTKEVIEVFE